MKHFMIEIAVPMARPDIVGIVRGFDDCGVDLEQDDGIVKHFHFHDRSWNLPAMLPIGSKLTMHFVSDKAN